MSLAKRELARSRGADEGMSLGTSDDGEYAAVAAAALARGDLRSTPFVTRVRDAQSVVASETGNYMFRRSLSQAHQARGVITHRTSHPR
jgi:hypothetical protein